MITRILSSGRHLNRLPEVRRCSRHTPDWLKLSLAYLGFKTNLPFNVGFKGGGFEFRENSDIATFWQIFYRTVYPVRDSDHLIVDAGANIGAFSLFAAQNSPARVVAVEPAPDTCDRFRSMVRANQLESRIELHEAALGPREGETTIEMNVASQFRRTGASGHRVRTITVDSLIPQGAFVDLLKIDIEGAEYAILSSISADTLRRVRRIALEFHPQASSDVALDPLRANGFKVTHYQDDGNGYGLALLEGAALERRPASASPLAQAYSTYADRESP